MRNLDYLSTEVAFQIFQTNRKLHRPNTTGRGGASRAEAEARHSLSLSLSYHSCNPCSRAHAAPRPKKTEHRHVEKRENPAPEKPAMCLANLAARERMCQGQVVLQIFGHLKSCQLRKRKLTETRKAYKRGSTTDNSNHLRVANCPMACIER